VSDGLVKAQVAQPVAVAQPQLTLVFHPLPFDALKPVLFLLGELDFKVVKPGGGSAIGEVAICAAKLGKQSRAFAHNCGAATHHIIALLDDLRLDDRGHSRI
jgi:hypothetical protein